MPAKAKTMTIAQLIEQFSNEDKCYEYLESVRWPDGIRCVRCESDEVSPIAKRRQYVCKECGYHFSVRVGTIFHDSHLPLWKWFLATYMITHAKKGMAALHLQKVLGVSYKTAWYLSHRIRAAMKQDPCEKLSGVVEVDETWIGGKVSGKGHRYTGNKTLVIGAIQRNGKVRLGVVKNQSKRALHGFIAENVDGKAEAIYTDQLRSYHGVADSDTRHETVLHNEGEYVRGDVHINGIEGMWALLKRSVTGTYHHLSPKHLPSYIEERAFVFNNRENPHIFRDTVMGLVQSEHLSFDKLVA